jgi:hypothetical protein
MVSSGTSSPRRYGSSRSRTRPSFAFALRVDDGGGGSCPGNAAPTAAPACTGPTLTAGRRGCGGAASTAPGSGHEQRVHSLVGGRAPRTGVRGPWGAQAPARAGVWPRPVSTRIHAGPVRNLTAVVMRSGRDQPVSPCSGQPAPYPTRTADHGSPGPRVPTRSTQAPVPARCSP